MVRAVRAANGGSADLIRTSCPFLQPKADDALTGGWSGRFGVAVYMYSVISAKCLGRRV